MINLSDITKAVEAIIEAAAGNYTITRNEERNSDPNTAVKTDAWIGIYRGSMTYVPYSTGGVFVVNPKPVVEIQCASFKSGADAEDKLQAVEKIILEALWKNRTLNNTVQSIIGFSITYDYNAADAIYHHAAVIELDTKVRTK